MKKIATVDEFIEQRVRPEHRPIVEELRKAMRRHAPSAKEVITYGILAWRGKKMLAVVSPTRKDITWPRVCGKGPPVGSGRPG